MAKTFKVKQGAMVEDLLKVLPGIQVNKRKLPPWAKRWREMLVDGEVFWR
ncbi:MAG: hypothetical protein IPJ31_13050 [Bacteroidetes bacterium]|nr:hypothetical protein [Bacteroidota bacterium]